MKKVLLLAVAALGIFASCSSSDDDNTPSWFVDKNITKADIADHYYQDSRINIHITETGDCMQVWRRDNTGGVGSNMFVIDGDSIRFTGGSKIAMRAHLVRYGELEPLTLVLSADMGDDFLPGGLRPGTYKQVK